MSAYRPLSRAKRVPLPRRYYKNRAVPAVVRTSPKDYVVEISAQLGAGNTGRANRMLSNLKKVFLQDIAKQIVNDSRAAHINMTMGNPNIPSLNPGPGSSAPGWKQLKTRGFLNEEVAIIVDGSPSRPIKNVKVFGEIIIMAPPNVEDIILAVETAWKFLVSFAAQAKGPFSGNMTKKGQAGRGYRYHSSFEIYINGTTRINSPADLRNPSTNFTADDVVAIVNYAPYAAKLERYRYPQSPFFQTFKKTRAKHGKKIGVKFAYTQGATTVASSGGAQIPNAQPTIFIGSPGLVTSGAPPMKKYIRQRPTHAGQRKKK